MGRDHSFDGLKIFESDSSDDANKAIIAANFPCGECLDHRRERDGCRRLAEYSLLAGHASLHFPDGII